MTATVNRASNLDQTLVARTEDLTAAQIEAELVIMHISSGNLYHLNRVATRIWESLEIPITLGALYARIEEQFDVSAETCRADVDELLRELASHGLIKETPPQE